MKALGKKQQKKSKIMRYFLALVPSLLPLVFGQAPFPNIVTGLIDC
jgi:hypothetical protein